MLVAVDRLPSFMPGSAHWRWALIALRPDGRHHIWVYRSDEDIEREASGANLGYGLEYRHALEADLRPSKSHTDFDRFVVEGRAPLDADFLSRLRQHYEAEGIGPPLPRSIAAVRHGRRPDPA